MAKTEFCTSEYYLSREKYRGLQKHFENTELRKIMEDQMFLDCFGCDVDYSLGSNLQILQVSSVKIPDTAQSFIAPP